MDWVNKHKVLSVVAGVLLLLAISTGISRLSSPSVNKSSTNNQNTTSEQQPAPPTQEKKEPTLLEAEVKLATDVPGVEVTNKETTNWDNCELELNGDYKREIRNPLEPGSPLNNPYGLFTKSDGTRFNISSATPKELLVKCSVSGVTRYNYYTF